MEYHDEGNAVMSAPMGYRVLPPRLSAEVNALAVRSNTHDGVKPLSEQTVLNLRRLPARPADAEPVELDGTRDVADVLPHLLILDRPGEIDAKVLAYAHIEDTDPVSVEIIVDPEHRGEGHGPALATQILRCWPAARFWAHGELPATQAIARRFGLDKVRELWQMSRPLQGEWAQLPDLDVPDGFEVRPFRVGADELRWLRVNSRAFTDHPEQGRMTVVDLEERIREPWFDPQGFLLVNDLTTPEPPLEGQPPTGGFTPRLAAFHWTKVEPAEPGSTEPAAGEVYVLGVDPDYQGRGLGTLTTLLGLRHLRACGLERVTLYVDGDNEAAIATYHRLGFERSTVDVMFAKEV